MASLQLELGDKHRFELSADVMAGYTWTARYDPHYCEVVISHKPARSFWGQARSDKPGEASITITTRSPGRTEIEFIYARREAWEQGEEPLDSFVMYLDIKP
ncbi:MAG: protease inhibitor I42 family protein [Lentisphaeria bacterium]